MAQEIDIGGRKVPIWVIGVGALGAVGLFILTKVKGGGGASTGLASSQYDQAIKTLNDQIQALATQITTHEPGSGVSPTPPPTPTPTPTPAPAPSTKPGAFLTPPPIPAPVGGGILQRFTDKFAFTQAMASFNSVSAGGTGQGVHSYTYTTSDPNVSVWVPQNVSSGYPGATAFIAKSNGPLNYSGWGNFVSGVKVNLGDLQLQDLSQGSRVTIPSAILAGL